MAKPRKSKVDQAMAEGALPEEAVRAPRKSKKAEVLEEATKAAESMVVVPNAPRAPRKKPGPIAKTTASGARVIFHELPSTPLFDMDLETVMLMSVADQDLEGAFVKVTAELRPSERDGFDGRAVKDAIRAHGAREVVLVTRAVHEAPDKETKKEVATAPSPEDAIIAWFDGLPIPEADREAAKAKALEILASERG